MFVNPQHIVLFHHFRRFLQIAAAEGIDAAPLKGAHLVKWVYPPDEDRGMMADVDFLVRDERYERSAEILEELGFRPKIEKKYYRLTQHAAFTLEVTENSSIMFELHRALFNPSRVQSIDHEALWARTTPATFDGQPCRRLSPEDMFVHVAFHSMIHRFMQLGRSTRDLELLLLHEQPDLDLLIERAKQWRFTRAVWLFCALLDEQRCDTDLSKVLRALEPPLHVRTPLRALVPDARATRVSGLHHRLQAALIWPFVFDSPALVTRMVLTHTSLRRAYLDFRERFNFRNES